MGLQTSPEEEREWAEQIKYYAARAIWHKRRATVPSGKYSWAIWFEKKYGEPYLKYVERMKQEKKRPLMRPGQCEEPTPEYEDGTNRSAGE